MRQTDLEEAKKEDNAKYESSLDEIQNKFKETEALLIKEREASKQVSEVLPIIKEVPVVDQELMEKLTNENETLKVGLNSGFVACVRWLEIHKSSVILLTELSTKWKTLLKSVAFLYIVCLMQGMVSSLEIKIDETAKELQETTRISQDRLKQALEAESKVAKLKTAMQRYSLQESNNYNGQQYIYFAGLSN